MTASQKQLLQQLAQMGEVTIVKPDGARIRLNDQAEIALKTQFDAVLYFMQRMDMNMLNLILHDKYTYQDYSKKVFLERLNLIFDIFIDDGSTFLNVFDGKCKGCYCNSPNIKGFTFEGNNKCNYRMNLLFELENNQVIDISACADFENDLEEIEPELYLSVSDYDFYDPDAIDDDDCEFPF